MNAPKDNGGAKAGRKDAAVLTFDGVCFDPDESTTFDLVLANGELAAFDLRAGEVMPEIANLAIGLTTPSHGKVTFLDKPWRELNEDETLYRRFFIGQVFNSHRHASWVENLDIDENVLLAEQMAGIQSREELARRSQQLAENFGLDRVPIQRRSAVSRDDLMRAQWVRAFLPKPLKLLILERPTLGMDPDSVNLLRAQIAKAREAGSAVVLIDAPLSESDQETLSPTFHFESIPSALRG